MLNQKEIIEILKQNDLSEVEILKSEKDLMLVNFYLDFDKDVLDAAKAYANEECDEEEDSEKWINDFLVPYLYDYANDEILSIIEDITEDLEIAGEFMAFQMKEEDKSYVQFMALFTEENVDVSIEEAVNDYIRK